jgi:hypothetical protein
MGSSLSQEEKNLPLAYIRHVPTEACKENLPNLPSSLSSQHHSRSDSQLHVNIAAYQPLFPSRRISAAPGPDQARLPLAQVFPSAHPPPQLLLEYDVDTQAVVQVSPAGLESINVGDLDQLEAIGLCSHQLTVLSPNLGFLTQTVTLQLFIFLSFAK